MFKRWNGESWVMAACFAAVWVYFLIWIAARKFGSGLSNWWQLILLPVLVIVLVITTRRVSRIKKEIDAQQKNQGTKPR
jgi:membrane protein implicated in regulation of membrane protease activity